jgi:hypothetical protein
VQERLAAARESNHLRCAVLQVLQNGAKPVPWKEQPRRADALGNAERARVIAVKNGVDFDEGRKPRLASQQAADHLQCVDGIQLELSHVRRSSLPSEPELHTRARLTDIVAPRR